MISSFGEVDPKIGYLIKDEEREDIENFISKFPNLIEEYIPVSIIGEGTFSTVYKAIDVCHGIKDNSKWIDSSKQDPYDAARLLALITSLQSTVHTRATKRIINSTLNQSILDFIKAAYDHFGDDEGALQRLATKFLENPPHFVAIKRINATSGPRRIAEELMFIRDLNGRHNVIPLISAKRIEDQVIVISPFFHFIDFRDVLISLQIEDVAAYIRLLLEALAHVHSHNIMHRDIKPSNFLFARPAPDDPHRQFKGCLVDFGLAQIEEQDMGKRAKTAGRKSELSCPDALRGSNLMGKISGLPAGHIVNDQRIQMKASRAGTRGFRAPEVLFKIAHQTVAIDVWSVGVILLTMLTRRYPFFQSTDDSDALVELACIFGNNEMSKAAKNYDRIWTCAIPSVPTYKQDWRDIAQKLNPTWAHHIPEEAFDLLDKLMDLNFRTRLTATDALNHPFLTNW